MSTTQDKDEGHPSRTLPDYLLTMTKLDETGMPSYCNTNEIAADFWRLAECLDLGKQQAQDLLLQNSSDLPVAKIPIHTQLLEVIARLVTKKDQIFLEIQSYMWFNQNLVLTYLHGGLPRFMELHGKQLSAQDRFNCFQMLTFNSEHTCFEDIWDLLDERLDLVRLYLLSKVKDNSGIYLKFVEAFAMFPFQHTKAPFVSMAEHLQNPPTDLINLTDYLGKKGEFENCESLRDDERSVRAITKLLLASKEYPDEVQLRVGVFWSRVVKDEQSLKEAVLVSFTAMNFMLDQDNNRHRTLNQDLAIKTQPEQLFEVLKSTQDKQLALETLMMLNRRLRTFIAHDQKYYQSQIIESTEEGEEPNYDQSDLYQLLKQICSLRLTVSEESIEEQSAFDEPEEPCLIIDADQGPIHQSLISDPKLLHNARMFLDGAWSSLALMTKCWELQRNTYVQEPVKVGDKVVLQQSLFKIRNQHNCITTLKQADPNAQSYQTWFESLIATWVSYLDSEVYWPPIDGCAKITLVKFAEKAEVIAFYIQRFCKQSREQIPEDFGARICDGKLLKILDQKILPLAGNKGPQSIDKVITAYVKLITVMIENEINLISRLTQPADNDESANIITRLIEAMKIWSPVNEPTLMLSKNENVKVILKFLHALSISEGGKIVASENGQSLLQVVLNSKSEAIYAFQVLRDQEDQLPLFEGGSIAKLCKQNPNVLLILKDTIQSRIAQAGSLADKLTTIFNIKIAEHEGNAQVAKQCLIYNHRALWIPLTQILSLLKIRLGRQRDGRGVSFDALVAVYSLQGYSLERDRLDVGSLIAQRQDIFKLMEQLTFLKFKNSLQLLQDVVTAMTESIDERNYEGVQNFDPKLIKPIVERLKSASLRFTDLTSAGTCTTYDQLTKDSGKFRQEFVNLRLYMMFQIMANGRVGLFFDWSSEIQLFIHIGRLRYSKTIDMTIDKLTNPLQHKLLQSLDSTFGETVEMPQSSNLKEYEQLLQQMKKCQLQMSQFTDQHFGSAQVTWDSAFNLFLKLIYLTSSQHHQRLVPGQSVVEVSNKNLVSIGETLAQTSKLLKTDFTEQTNLLEQLCHNQSILQVLLDFNKGLRCLDMMTVAFIFQGGLEPLCQLYKSLIQLETRSLLQTEGSDQFKLQDAILKCLMYNQRIDLGQLLNCLIKAYLKKSVKDEQISEYTKGYYESCSHLLLNQFGSMYSIILEWNLTESQLILQTKSQSQAQDSVVFDLLITLQEKPWDQKQESKNERPSSQVFRQENNRGAQQQQVVAERDPTDDEIQQVTALGFDEYMAGNALRMSRYNPEQAIEILLTNPEGLYQYIETQNVERLKKEQLEMEKVIKMSMSIPQDQKVKSLTILEFEKIEVHYRDNILMQTLFQVSDQTQVTRKQALQILWKVVPAHISEQSQTTLISKLLESNDEFLIQILIIFMQKGKLTEVEVVGNNQELITNLIKLGTNLIEANNESGLYYLSHLLNKRSSQNQELQSLQEMKDFNLNILNSDSVSCCCQNTKELVLLTIYQYLKYQLLPTPELAQQIALEYISKIKPATLQQSSSQFIQLINILAMYSGVSAARLFNSELQLSFRSMFEYKSQIASNLNIPTTTTSGQIEAQYVQYRLKDIVQLLSQIGGDIELIKLAIQKQCNVIANRGEIYLTANFDLKQQQGDSDVELIDQVQPNELYVFMRGLDKFMSTTSNECQSMPNSDCLVMPQKYYDLVQLGLLTQVHPHLISLISADFLSELVQQLCCLTTQGNPINLQCTVSDLLCSILGYNNQLASKQESQLRQSLKIIVIKSTITQLSQSSQSTSALTILYTLLKVDNCNESNRVQLPQHFYDDSIEYIVTQTDFLQMVQRQVEQIVQEYDVENKEQEINLRLIIECLSAICDYFELNKSEAAASLEQLAAPLQINQEIVLDQFAQPLNNQHDDPQQDHNDNEGEGQQDDEDDDDQYGEDDEDQQDELEAELEEVEQNEAEEFFENALNFGEESDEDAEDNEQEQEYFNQQNQINQQQHQDILNRPQPQAAAARYAQARPNHSEVGLQGNPFEFFQQMLREQSNPLISHQIQQQRQVSSSDWTEQEQLAQWLLHSLLETTEVGKSTRKMAQYGRPKHTTQVLQFSEVRIECNQMSQKFNVLKPLSKQELCKEIQSLHKDFLKNTKVTHQKESTLFRDICLDPRTHIPSGSIDDIQSRRVQDVFNDRHSDREARIQMLMEAERVRHIGAGEPRQAFGEAGEEIDILALTLLPQPQQPSVQNLSAEVTQWLTDNNLVQVMVEEVVPQLLEEVKENPIRRSDSMPFLDPPSVDESIELAELPALIEIAQVVEQPIPVEQLLVIQQQIPIELQVVELPIEELNVSIEQNQVSDEESKEPSIIEQEGSAFDQLQDEEIKQEEPIVEVPAIVEEPVVVQVQQPVVVEEPSSYGIPHSVLLAHEIDPEILYALPEEVREELLASVEWQPAAQQVQQPAQQQEPAQQQQPQSQLDQDFLNSLPADIRAEIVEEERRRMANQAAVEQAALNGAQPAEMDLASFIQTLEDPRAREEVLLGLEPAQILELPPNLRAEVAQLQDRMNERIGQQRQAQQQRMMDPRGLVNRGMDHRPEDGWGVLDPEHRRLQQTLTSKFEKTLAEIQTLKQLEAYMVTPDECYFGLLKLQKDSTSADIAKVEAAMCSLKVTESFISILMKFTLMAKKSSDDFETKFNLIGMMNSLSKLKQDKKFVNRDAFTDAISTQLQANFQKLTTKDNEVTNEQLLTQSLVLITCSRIFVKSNKKYATKLLKDFLTTKQVSPICIIIEQLNYLDLGPSLDPTEQKSKMYMQALVRNLQSCLIDILTQSERSIDYQQLCETAIPQLFGLFKMSVNRVLNSKVTSVLTKVSCQDSTNWQQVHQLCYGQLEEAQKQIINALVKINLILSDEEQVLDELPQITMVKKQSQQSQVRIPEKDSKVISSDQIQEIEFILQQSEKQLPILGQTLKLYQTFSASPQISDLMDFDIQKMIEKHQGHKQQLQALNQVLLSLQNSKSQTLLLGLSRHISSVFEVSQDELKAIVEEQAESVDDQSVRMQPIKSELTYESEKHKMSASIFKQEIEITDQLFELCKFCLINRELINKILGVIEQTKETSNLVKMINYMPNVLNFKRKQGYFRKEITKQVDARHAPNVHLVINRKQIFIDSYAQLSHKSVRELKGPLRIDYTGERGIDAGGLTRDFYIELSRALFNPNYSLFTPTSNGVSFHPNQQSHVNPDHLNFFKFIGRVIGKALFDNELLEVNFSKPMYKMMVGDDLVFEDLQDLDNVFHKSCMWTMKEDVTGLGFTFSINRDYFGRIETKQLIDNGSSVVVTNENKISYLEKLGCYQMYLVVKEQIDAFLKGFHELIPKKLVGIFTAAELELLISGLPKVDLNDMKSNTDLSLYSPNSPQVLWLWKCLESFNQEEIGRFLQFVTGCSRVPLAGFAALQGMQGTQKFNIIKVTDTSRLPQGHTCFNTLDLPEYNSYEILRDRILYAIMNTGGFGFA